MLSSPHHHTVSTADIDWKDKQNGEGGGRQGKLVGEGKLQWLCELSISFFS